MENFEELFNNFYMFGRAECIVKSDGSIEVVQYQIVDTKKTKSPK